MMPAQRGNIGWRVSSPAAENVKTIDAHAEDRGVPVEACLPTPLESMLAARIGEILAHLKQIGKGPHDRAGGVVEGLKQPVGKSQPRLSVIEGGIVRRRPDESKGRFGSHLR